MRNIRTVHEFHLNKQKFTNLLLLEGLVPAVVCRMYTKLVSLTAPTNFHMWKEMNVQYVIRLFWTKMAITTPLFSINVIIINKNTH